MVDSQDAEGFGCADPFTTPERVEGGIDAGLLFWGEGGEVVEGLENVSPCREVAKLLWQIGTVPPDNRRHGRTIPPGVSGNQPLGCLVVHSIRVPSSRITLAIAPVEPAVGELEVVVVAGEGLFAPPFAGEAPRTGH